jgi:sugar lactone lactonase YvrE
VRIDNGEVHADLSSLGGEYLNDMVVDESGRAYVDYLHLPPGGEAVSDETSDGIILVEPNGEFRFVARGGGMCNRPNGLVITPDGSTLIVAMGPIHKLVAFTIESDGSLGEPRVFADMGEEGLDGICLDADGSVWVASPRTSHFLRVREGGEVVETLSSDPKWAVACMLGGPDRRTLFMATADMPANPTGGMRGNLHEAHGFIEITKVDVPGAGLP